MAKYLAVVPVVDYGGVPVLIRRRETPEETRQLREWHRRVFIPWQRSHPDGPREGESAPVQPVALEEQLQVEGDTLSVLRTLVVRWLTPLPAQVAEQQGFRPRPPRGPEEARAAGKILDVLAGAMNDDWSPCVPYIALEDQWATLAEEIVRELAPEVFRDAVLAVYEACQFSETMPETLHAIADSTDDGLAAAGT